MNPLDITIFVLVPLTVMIVAGGAVLLQERAVRNMERRTDAAMRVGNPPFGMPITPAGVGGHFEGIAPSSSAPAPASHARAGHARG